jgi:hypothetical protein
MGNLTEKQMMKIQIEKEFLFFLFKNKHTFNFNANLKPQISRFEMKIHPENLLLERIKIKFK